MSKRKPSRKLPGNQWSPGHHPVTWSPEPFRVDVLAVHPQLVCVQFQRAGFEASGYLSLPDLKALHARLGELIAPFESSIADLDQQLAERLATAAAGSDQP